MRVSDAREALEIEEEEGRVLADGAADAAAVDILDELALAQVVEVVGPLVGIEARRAVEPEAVAVKLVGAGLGHEHDVGAAVAADVRGGIAGDDAEFAERIGIGAGGGEVGAAGGLGSLLSMPSRVKFQARSRAPWT